LKNFNKESQVGAGKFWKKAPSWELKSNIFQTDSPALVLRSIPSLCRHLFCNAMHIKIRTTCIVFP